MSGGYTSGESGPMTVTFSSGAAISDPITLTTASGTSGAPSSQRRATIGGGPSSTVWLYWEVVMDQEDWKNPGFVSCPNAGSYYCQTSCTNGFASPTPFVALPGGLCGKSNVYIEAQTGGGWSGLKEAPIEDCGPHTCSNPYWLYSDSGADNSPYPGGCMSDALYTQLGATPNATTLWKFAQ